MLRTEAWMLPSFPKAPWWLGFSPRSGVLRTLHLQEHKQNVRGAKGRARMGRQRQGDGCVLACLIQGHWQAEDPRPPKFLRDDSCPKDLGWPAPAHWAQHPTVGS